MLSCFSHVDLPLGNHQSDEVTVRYVDALRESRTAAREKHSQESLRIDVKHGSKFGQGRLPQGRERNHAFPTAEDYQRLQKREMAYSGLKRRKLRTITMCSTTLHRDAEETQGASLQIKRLKNYNLAGEAKRYATFYVTHGKNGTTKDFSNHI